MIIKIKKIIKIFYINSIVFFLSILAVHVNAETKIIAKSDDTLLKISIRYGVPLKELMYKNNFNDATKIIEGEIIIIPLKSSKKEKKNEQFSYKVKEGDTLYKIARDYKVNLKDIMTLNNLEHDSYLKLNQIILLPREAINQKQINKENIKLASKKVFYHKTSSIEDLTNIAEIHKISIKQISAFNNLKDPIKINPNIKLRLRKTMPSKWIKYGSIIVNWSDWTYFDGNYIAQAKTKKNTPFYIALSCERRVLNNTLNNSYWTNWYFPKTDFEFKLINNFCDNDFKF